jgi:CBS domain containing-hemolysin-like protein
MILRLFGFQTIAESELAHSEEELRLILANDTNVSTTSRRIALNAMDFHQKQARHAMVPRKEIVALSIEAPVIENIAIMRNNKFSRFPVFKGTIDNITGIIYTKDIFKHDRHLQPDFTLNSVLRDASFLPETATLEKALTTIQQKKTHMIILADEYGGTAGLVTLENVLEELVGSIQDEFDRETPDFVKINEDEYIVDGSLTTNDVERLISVDFSPMDIRSISGFVIEQLGHIPEVGEQTISNGIEFTTRKVVDNAVVSIHIKKLTVPSDNDEKS